MAAVAPIIPLVERVRPVTLAGDQLLPVEACLTPLLPQEGLMRGTTIGVGGPLAATSLAVALVVRAARAGSWVAAVGLGGLGLTAVEELGFPLERLVLVAAPPPAHWAATVAALVEGFDVVLVGPPVRVRPVEARRLVARVRERRSLLVQVDWPRHRWPEEPELTLAATRACWDGIGAGWGHCRARRVEVEGWGRRAGDRRRRRWLWLPGPDGLVADVVDADVATTAGVDVVDADVDVADVEAFAVADTSAGVGQPVDAVVMAGRGRLRSGAPRLDLVGGRR